MVVRDSLDLLEAEEHKSEDTSCYLCISLEIVLDMIPHACPASVVAVVVVVSPITLMIEHMSANDNVPSIYFNCCVHLLSMIKVAIQLRCTPRLYHHSSII